MQGDGGNGGMGGMGRGAGNMGTLWGWGDGECGDGEVIWGQKAVVGIRGQKGDGDMGTLWGHGDRGGMWGWKGDMGTVWG